MKIQLKQILMSSVIVFGFSAAHAEYYKLYSPHIVQGEGALEAMNAMTQDSDENQNQYVNQIFGFEYSPTEFWKFELSLELERDPGKNQAEKATNYKFENVFVPYKSGEQWMDWGLYLEIEKAATGDAYNVETKALLEKEISGDVIGLMNAGINKGFGKDAAEGVFGAMSIQLKYRMNKAIEPAVEYYSSLGRIDKMEPTQQIGPVVQGKLANVLYDTGVLFATSDKAPQLTYKLNLEMEF